MIRDAAARILLGLHSRGKQQATEYACDFGIAGDFWGQVETAL
jgi:hypothetical protein